MLKRNFVLRRSSEIIVLLPPSVKSRRNAPSRNRCPHMRLKDWVCRAMAAVYIQATAGLWQFSVRGHYGKAAREYGCVGRRGAHHRIANHHPVTPPATTHRNRCAINSIPEDVLRRDVKSTSVMSIQTAAQRLIAPLSSRDAQRPPPSTGPQVLSLTTPTDIAHI